MNILLVSPATPETFWSFRHILHFLSKKAAFPPLGLLTVAAMLPRHWNLRLVDLDVRRLTDADIEWADCVFISAMLIHEASVRQIAVRCAARGKPVVGGGPLFTTSERRFPEIPCLVLGEAEELMPQLVADLEAGRLQPVYRAQSRPDIRNTPVPRWDLISPRDYMTMSVQFSRGCPFNCEFCDIVAMYGRVPRTKTPAQLIRELDALLAVGWRGSVFIVDDNFIGHRAKAKELLAALIEWRARNRVRLPFITEASLNLVDDPELLRLMVAAGFKRVFIGLETPEEGSLAECAKIQNTRRNMLEAVRTIQRAGLEVLGGFIIGFDHDPPSIFERQRRFIEEAGVVAAMVGLLNALPQTPLFARLLREGRILAESTGNNLDAVLNFVPRMDRQMLLDGYKALVKHLYSPREYYRRAMTFLRHYRRRGPRPSIPWNDVAAFVRSLWEIGIRASDRLEYWKYVLKTLLLHPRAFAEAMNLAIMGYHFRKVAARL